MKRGIVAAVLSFALLSVTVAQDAPKKLEQAPAGTYLIDPAHTSIGFTVTHLGISEIAGRFNQSEGRFTLGEQPAFEATIQVESVDTGIEKRDDHLRSPDFFNVEKHPTITFRSTGVEKLGQDYRVTGDFTMNGQTKPIVLPLRYLGAAEFHGVRAGFAGELTIDRREWGLTAWQGGLVGNDIRMKISFEGIKE